MAEEVEKLAGEQAAGVRATVSDEQAQATPRLNVLDQVCDPQRRALAVVVYLLSISRAKSRIAFAVLSSNDAW